jgi:hypothetical protein
MRVVVVVTVVEGDDQRGSAVMQWARVIGTSIKLCESYVEREEAIIAPQIAEMTPQVTIGCSMVIEDDQMAILSSHPPPCESYQPAIIEPGDAHAYRDVPYLLSLHAELLSLSSS